jgi:hypothetical protein
MRPSPASLAICALSVLLPCAGCRDAGGGDDGDDDDDDNDDDGQVALPDDLPGADELAATPRADVVAEDIALRFTPERWTADEDLYGRVVVDLPVIRSALPETDFPLVATHKAALGVHLEIGPADDHAGDAAVAEALVDRLRGDATVDDRGADNFLVVDGAWPGLLQPSKVTEAFVAAIDGDIALISSGAGGRDDEGARIDLKDADGDVLEYLFLDYGGDCPEGCTTLRAFRVATGPAAAPVLLDTFDSATATECPEWLAGRRCPLGA